MKVILVYDVDEKRVTKYYKLIKQYLHWKQRSVFYGNLSKSQLYELKLKLQKLINGEDQIIIFIFPENTNFKKEVLGKKDKDEIDEFII